MFKILAEEFSARIHQLYFHHTAFDKTMIH